MKKENFTKNGYFFKNYIFLNDSERKMVLEWRNKNRKWMINSNIITIEEHLKWIKSLNERNDILYFLVFKKETPFMCVDFHNINYETKEAYWGYFLGQNGFKKEVLKIEKTIIELAFSELQLDKICCINNVDNHVINIHNFFGFKNDKIIEINGRKFLKMCIEKEMLC